MTLDGIKKIWSALNNLGGTTKSVIIVVLFGFILGNYIENQNKTIIKQYYEYINKTQDDSEKYTIKMAPEINACIQGIAKQDSSAVDVMLLGYHNSKRTLQGFSYVYLDYITESINEIDRKPLRSTWKDLEYIYYQDELTKIHDKGYLKIKDIENIRQSFPKLYERLYESNVKAAVFISIKGSEDRPLGMVIIFYKNPQLEFSNYYSVTHYITQIAAILDYQHINERMKNGNKQEKWGNMF